MATNLSYQERNPPVTMPDVHPSGAPVTMAGASHDAERGELGVVRWVSAKLNLKVSVGARVICEFARRRCARIPS